MVRGFNCKECGKLAIQNSKAQKYCPECSDRISKEKHNKRNAKYRSSDKFQKSYLSKVQSGEIKAKANTRHQLLKSRGLQRSIDGRTDDKWDNAVRNHHYKWAVKIEFPFNKLMSKNSIWSYGSKRGHVYIRKEVKAVCEKITVETRATLRNYDVKKGKLWMGLYVQKPTHKSDAINLLDLFADAVKEAIDFDDNMFSIMFIDWAVVKESPKVFLYLGQEIEEDHFGCSYCGFLQPTSKMVGKDGRLCTDCSRA